jgi:hypothetical protein
MFHPWFNPAADAGSAPRPDTGGMSITDYALNALLVLVVVRQIRGRRLAGLSLYLPLAIVAYVGVKYLHTVPTGGHDLVLELSGAAAGLALGALCAVYTRVYPDHDGVPYAKATWLAAFFWILGVGARLGFALYAQHGGGAAIERFSGAHDITSMETWVTTLIVMALVEVLSRTTVLVLRGRRLPSAARSGEPAIIEA